MNQNNSQTHKSKTSKIYQQSVSKQLKEKNMKSVSNKVKKVFNGQKFANSGSRPTFKPQTTRAIKNINSYNQKSVIKPKDKSKIAKLGHLNKSNKYTGIRGGAKSLIISNPRDSIKRRGQNKTTMNFSKERTELKKFSKQVPVFISKQVPITVPKHRKNVTSGGSYSTMQGKGVLKKKYTPTIGNKLGYPRGALSSNSKLKSNYSKQMRRIKQKPSHTFGDLSRISLILSKGSIHLGKFSNTHTKNKYSKGKWIEEN